MKPTAVPVLLLFISVTARSQHISVSKSTQTIQPATVEISSPAIPMNEAGDVEIDSATYHKSAVMGSEPDRNGEVVQISVPAIAPSAHIQSVQKKEVVDGVTVPDQSAKEERRTVPVSAVATPR